MRRGTLQIVTRSYTALASTSSPDYLSHVRCRRLNSSASAAAATTEEEPMQSAFDIMGIPEQFSIDEKDLKNKYRALMSEYHPDRNRHISSKDQEVMQQKSSAVTNAYQQLTAPHTRAAHLMALRGKPVTETLSQSLVGMEFLMEVMEIRESIENVTAGSDDELRLLLEENAKRIAKTCQEFENALESSDLDRALHETARLQYWNRVAETIREKMESFE